MKDQLTKELLKIYALPFRREGSSVTMDEVGISLRNQLKKLSTLIPEGERDEVAEAVALKTGHPLHLCTTCGDFMTEGFVIREPHQARFFCSEQCMLEAGVSMEEFDQNYDEEGNEYDPWPNPDWNSYYMQWY